MYKIKYSQLARIKYNDGNARMKGKKQQQKKNTTRRWNGIWKKEKKMYKNIQKQRQKRIHTHTHTHARALHTSPRRCVASSGGECIASAKHSHTNDQWRHTNVGEKDWEREGRTQRNNRQTKRNNSAGAATRAYAIKKGKENDEEPSTTCTDVLVVRRYSLNFARNTFTWTQRIREFIDMPRSVYALIHSLVENGTQAFDIAGWR